MVDSNVCGENLEFNDALKDSPVFRHKLSRNENYVNSVEQKIREVIRHINQFVDFGHRYVNSFQNSIESMKELNAFLNYDEQVFDAVQSVTDLFNEFSKIHKVLVEQAYWSIVKNLNDFLKRDFSKIQETKLHFIRVGQSLDEALIKNSQVSKNKEQDAYEARNELTAVGTCFAHTALDYVFQINLLKSRQKFEILEALGGFLNACRTFSRQAKDIFFVEKAESPDFDSSSGGGESTHQQSTYCSGDKTTESEKPKANLEPILSSLKQQSRICERKMQDRHMLVPKEIFQHPPGMPTDPDVVMEGYLFKRATNAFKTWNRRWFVIRDSKLLYCHRDAESSHQSSGRGSPSNGHFREYTITENDLRLCLVRPAQNSLDRRCCFELVTPTRIHVLQADSESLCNAWIKALQRSIESALHDSHNESSILVEDNGSSSANNLIVYNSTAPSTSVAGLSLNLKCESQSSSPKIDHSDCPNINVVPIATSTLKSKSVADFLCSIPGNELCADCGAFDPKWASINLGVTLCIECCSIHRSMGVQVSKVRSLTLDAWEPEHVRLMEMLGNNVVNAAYLENMPAIPMPLPAKPDSSRAVRDAWIKAKYLERRFVNFRQNKSRSSLRLTSNNEKGPKISLLVKRNNRTLSTPSNNDFVYEGINSVDKIDVRSSVLTSHSHPDLRESLKRRSALKYFIGTKKELLDSKADNFLIGGGSESVLLDKAKFDEETQQTTQSRLLLSASKSADLKAMCRALSRKACVNFSAPENNSTCLHEAVFSGSLEACEYLLLNGAKINVQDSAGRTPLHLASELGHTAQVCQLLKRGANQDVTNLSGKTALDLAMDSTNADIVTLLRLAKLNDEIKEADVLNPGDETFADVVRDFSHMASNRPEILKRN